MSFRAYFSFSRRQTFAVITLLGIIALLSLTAIFLPARLSPEIIPPDASLGQQLALLQTEAAETDRYGVPGVDTFSRKLTPFAFDPNTLDEDGFRRLGLREKLIRTLLNYRSKGGRFYNKQSLQRIYGLRDDEYRQLEPYIAIPDGSGQGFASGKKEVLFIELNSADTASLNRLRGIGHKLSMNIVQYRERLGGFVRVDQLKEVYGISEETFAIIRPSCHVNKSLVQKINLQTATFNEINAHPYLRGELARAIVDLRKAKNYHIENLGELREIELINEEIFRKIAPYLSLQTP